MIVCVFSNAEVGIDIERIQQIKQPILDRYLMSNETDCMGQTMAWTIVVRIKWGYADCRDRKVGLNE